MLFWNLTWEERVSAGNPESDVSTCVPRGVKDLHHPFRLQKVVCPHVCPHVCVCMCVHVCVQGRQRPVSLIQIVSIESSHMLLLGVNNECECTDKHQQLCSCVIWNMNYEASRPSYLHTGRGMTSQETCRAEPENTDWPLFWKWLVHGRKGKAPPSGSRLFSWLKLSDNR